MSLTAARSLLARFDELPDPRREHGRWHKLSDIIALTICAVVAGADSWVDVEEYGHRKYDLLASFLDLANGIPSHDTIGRVFSLLKPEAFQECFAAWVRDVAQGTQGRVIAVDGKTSRHSYDRAAGQAALHVVSAWATANHLVLGQRAVADKSNEITALPAILQIIDIQGAIVTIDAMGCQKKVTVHPSFSRKKSSPRRSCAGLGFLA